MVSKNQLKLIKSLHQKKYRNEHGLFFVEGVKGVKELLNSSFKVFKVLVTKEFNSIFPNIETEEITDVELKNISALKNPSGVLAIFEIPEQLPVDLKDWIVVLDDVRDPGNLGTIIRLCDWYGIKSLVCSKETVDSFNPKVLQATMGSIARVNIVYRDLEVFLTNTDLPIFGSFMKGTSIYKKELPDAGVLIMGNEANGISIKVEHSITEKITIPQFGNQSAESLNVATATGIILSKIRGGS
ncbi:RNA methyltransferase [Croceitalea sp. MTPC9]|uniref:TrmH family RNA methyltransferase n=1 Tax=unclassified Croceitalea TaxID=2632280 RepID=UPI002B3C8F4D|nr:RNA methyltransferase [Croceitalea sp. MTPC6]GMN18431.1 RNA methyltransferase [Croceitalea sp. MTPC9]